MAEDQQQPDAAQAQAEAERARTREARAQERRRSSGSEAEEFPVERLTNESQAFFGQPPHVVVGALYLAKSQKKNMTVADTQEAIEAFLAHTPDAPEEA